MMSLDNSIVRKIYGTVIPQEESVCAVGGGGGWGEGTLIKIPRCGPDAFYRVHTLGGIWGLSPCMGSGAKPVAKNSFRSFQRAKMSPQDTQLNTIPCSYIFLPKSN